MGICGKEILYALVIMLGPFTFGTVLCFPSPAKRYIYAEHEDVRNNEIFFDLFNSASSLFALFGPFFVTFLLKVFHGSRKKTVFVITTCACVLWLLTLLTKVHIWAGIIVRAFSGVCIGAFSSISPMYIIEIAPESARGFFGCLNQVGIDIGLVFLNIIAPSVNSYFSLCYISAAFCALQMILIWFIPESPAVEREAEEIERKQKSQTEDYQKESLFQKKYAFGLTVGFLLMFFQQFCGCNSILTNLSDIMSQAGLNLHPDYQAGITQFAQLVAVFVGSAVMDKLGRRIVFIISVTLIVIFLLVFVLYLKLEIKNNALPLVSIFFYEFGFGIGMGPIPWFIIPEYFNDAVRPLATTLVSSSNWIFSFIVIVTFPSMKNKMGLWGAMTVYLVASAIGLVFGALCIQEPKAQDYDEGSPEGSSSSSEKPESL